MIAVAVVLVTILAFCAWWYRAWDQRTTDADQAATDHHLQLCDLLTKLDAGLNALDRRLAGIDEADSRRLGTLRADLNILHNDLEHINIHIPELPPQIVRLPS